MTQPERELQVKVSLVGAKPPIWRRLVLRDGMTLVDLHQAIQIAMGWLDCHLYDFDVKGQRFVEASLDSFEKVQSPDSVSLRDLKLRRRGTKFHYCYDFGDDWYHLIEIEAFGPLEVGASYPRCLTGRRAGPPENVGGIHGYARALAIRDDPGHPEYRELEDWFPTDWDPARFDLRAVNRLLGKAFPARENKPSDR